MKDYAERLIESRARAWEQAKALLDSAEAENRELTAEERQSWDSMNADIDAKDRQIQELLDSEERSAKADEARARFEALARPQRQEAEGRARGEMEELASFLRGESGQRSLTVVEKRDLVKSVAASGGNTVPTSFRSLLMEHLIDTASIRQSNVTVLTTDKGEDLQVPKTSAYSTASLISEGSAITESDATFGQVTLQAFKYAILIQVSRELLDDSAVNLADFLARQAGRAVGDKSGEHQTAGDGSSKPNGIVTASSSGASAASGAVAADNLIDLYHSVIAGYRRNGTWMMRDATAKEVRKLKDTTNQYLWAPGLVVGTPDTLLGRPVVTNPHMAAIGTGAKSVVFGDFGGYFIRDVNGVMFERSDEFAFNADLVTFRCIFRTDGDLVDTNAVKHLLHA